jgi:hypothetical protein
MKKLHLIFINFVLFLTLSTAQNLITYISNPVIFGQVLKKIFFLN